MGCINSKSATVVQQLTRDTTDSESTHDEPEDLAVSEATDSGVAIPVIFWDIPGVVPPLSSESFTASSSEEVPKETSAPVVLQQEEPSERPQSSEILGELISPEIVPLGSQRGGEWASRTEAGDALQWQMEDTTSTSEEEEYIMYDICDGDDSSTSDQY